MIALADLITPVTTDEAREAIYNVMAAVGVDVTTWKPGAVVRTLVTACAFLIAALSSLMALIAKSGFLDFAEGDWLTLVARHVYGVERIAATFAPGVLLVSNSTGNNYNIPAGDLIFLNPTSGKTYRNTQAETVGPNAVNVSVEIEAVEAGALSTSAAGTITALETVVAGLTCTNPTAVIGFDEESDPALKSRCLAKTGAASPNGPADAYAYFARNAKLTSGASAGITRCTVVKDGTGGVTVYVAGASGAVTGSIGDLNTPLGAADDAVQRNAVPLAVTADVVSATPLAIAVTYELQMFNSSGLSEAAIKAAVVASLTSFMAAQQIGGNAITGPGKVFLSAISAAISGAVDGSKRPLPIFRVILSAPAADVAVSSNQVPTLGTVTASLIRQVAPGNL